MRDDTLRVDRNIIIMAGHQPPVAQQVTSIILLTEPGHAERLIPLLLAHKNDLIVIQINHPNELLDFPESLLSSGRLVSFGSRQYVPEDILQQFGHGCYEVRFGPADYPGWAALNFAVYNQVKQFGVVLHEMLKVIDSGPIIATRHFSCTGHETHKELTDLTANEALALFADHALALATQTGRLAATAQAWGQHLYTKWQFTSFCVIPSDIDKQELHRRIGAFGEGDGQTRPFVISDNRVFIYQAKPLTEHQDGLVLHDLLFAARK